MTTIGPEGIDGTEPPRTPREAPADDGLLKGHPFRSGFLIGVLVTIVVALLIIQNSETVQLEWLFLDFEWPLWVLLLLTFLAGMVAWQLMLFGFRRARKRSAERRTVRKDRRAAKKRDKP